MLVVLKQIWTNYQSLQKLINMKFLTKLIYLFWWFIPRFAKFWYTLTMKFSKTISTDVLPASSYQEIGERLSWGKRYRADKWDGKLDNLTHPTEIQKRIILDKDIGDCDDHAIYWATCLLKSDLVLKVWFSFYQMKSKETGKLSGHVVCVFVDKENKMKWCDYRMPTEIENRWDWAEQSAQRYNSEVLTGAMIEVASIEPDDTPVFGEVDTKVW